MEKYSLKIDTLHNTYEYLYNSYEKVLAEYERQKDFAKEHSISCDISIFDNEYKALLETDTINPTRIIKIN